MGKAKEITSLLKKLISRDADRNVQFVKFQLN